MARMHGRNGRIEVVSVSPVAVFPASEWTLDRRRDTVDVTSFGDANKTYVAGLEDVSGTAKSFYDAEDGSPDLSPSLAGLEAAETGEPVTIRLYPNYVSYPDRYFEGPVYLDYSMQTSVSGAVTLSWSFKGSGAWTRQ